MNFVFELHLVVNASVTISFTLTMIAYFMLKTLPGKRQKRKCTKDEAAKRRRKHTKDKRKKRN